MMVSVKATLLHSPWKVEAVTGMLATVGWFLEKIGGWMGLPRYLGIKIGSAPFYGSREKKWIGIGMVYPPVPSRK